MGPKSKVIFKCLFLVVVGTGVQVEGNVCFKQELYPNIQIGKKLSGEPMGFYQAGGLLDCYGQCGLYSLCQSINYNVETHQCELLALTNTTTEPVVNNIIMEVPNRHGQLFGSCENHVCPQNTVCQTDGPRHTCVVVGCHRTPNRENVNVTSFEAKSLWLLNETVLYPCQAGYYPSSNATCYTNGTWSPFLCQPFTGCRKRIFCVDFIGVEGEYWIFSRQMNSWIKAFCPPSEYNGDFITLHDINMFSTPIFFKDPQTCAQIPTDSKLPSMGYTEFQKIRFSSYKMMMDVDNFLYSNSTFHRQNFGSAGDCVNDTTSDCGLIGRFVINTNGTGLRIKSSVTWETWGVGGRVGNITRSQDGHRIEGYCGSVVGCGGCQPRELLTELDPDYTPPLDSATLVKCKAHPTSE
ncbi:hypothetical protein SNE40_015776 [Patella caerulea]|uniref:Sushi domain-containing protein n=1 Tax=Patella caerulea TaxID=87958 RepID=A0AAN8PFH0_PATCE